MSYYLATTGISEIWNFESELLLLGPWCLNAKNRNILKDKKYIRISSPFKPAEKIKASSDYCQHIYEKMLPQLAEKLNCIHKVSFPVKYWRVLLGPWLLHFIGVFYERYRRMENALELYPDLVTHVLPYEECRPVSCDTSNFINNKIHDDLYNLKLFSLIAYDLCPEKITETRCPVDLKGYQRKYPWKRRILNYFLNHFLAGGTTVLSDMYHLTTLDKIRLKMNRRLAGIGFFELMPIDKKKVDDYSQALRQSIRLDNASDDFQTLLYKIIPDALPVCNIEGYEAYKENTSKRFPQIGPLAVMGSATGWYFNEEFKYLAAEAVSRDVRLADFQHGGGYGLFLSTPSEIISLEKDIFYTWGWTGQSNNTKPLPSPHLSRLKDSHCPKLNKVLFVGTGRPIYHHRFSTHIQPDDMKCYFEEKTIFFETTADKVKENVLYRPYPMADLWEEEKLIRKICPGVSLVKEKALFKWLQKVQLAVIDHPHTSFLEALAINVPSIFYWDYSVYLMRPGADDYLKLLKDAGILHANARCAAEKVNEVWMDVESWWSHPDRQNARREFMNRFCLTSPDWRNEWIAAFSR